MSGIIDTVGSKSGILGSDVYPAGHIIQIVHHGGSGSTTATGDIGFGGGITITAGNKIWLSASIQMAVYAGGANVGVVYEIKDSTNSDAVVQVFQIYIDEASTTNSHELDTVVPFNALYTPATGTTINFELHVTLNWGGSAQTNMTRSHLTLCEVQV